MRSSAAGCPLCLSKVTSPIEMITLKFWKLSFILNEINFCIWMRWGTRLIGSKVGHPAGVAGWRQGRTGGARWAGEINVASIQTSALHSNGRPLTAGGWAAASHPPTLSLTNVCRAIGGNLKYFGISFKMSQNVAASLATFQEKSWKTKIVNN